MYENLYCKVFVNTELSYDELFLLLLEYLGGTKQAVSYISADWCELSVRQNKERDASQAEDFIYWKYIVDAEPVGGDESTYILRLRKLVQYLKKHCKNVCAACDFEDDLI